LLAGNVTLKPEIHFRKYKKKDNLYAEYSFWQIEKKMYTRNRKMMPE